MLVQKNLVLAILFITLSSSFYSSNATAETVRLDSWWQQRTFLTWANHEEAVLNVKRPNRATDETNLNEPDSINEPLDPREPLTPQEISRIRKSTLDYFRAFGKNTVSSLLWTGVESANPLTRDEHDRWDSLKEEGMYDHATRVRLARQLKSLGIRNIRLGMSNDKIDLHNEESWSQTTAMIDDFANEGLRISLDLHHFGIEDRFRQADAKGATINETSYYLNPSWPAYFAKFARRAIEKYHDKISAVTIMNEPETVVGFNGEMWNGGFPGWSSSATNFWYIERCLQVAKASILARLEIEEYFAQNKIKTPLVYMHTEASIIKPYWEEFNLYRRFIISDLILGSDWVVGTDFENAATRPIREVEAQLGSAESKNKTSLGWLIENFALINQPPEKHEGLRNRLLDRLGELQKLHGQLKQRFGKTMKSDTILAVDYYAQNEDRDVGLKALRAEPLFYSAEIIEGRRTGLYRLMVDYFNHFKMPVMVGETGTPFYTYGSRWHQQMLLECAKAAREGVPFLGYTLYPAVDTWGWESALSLPRAQAIENPAGIFDLQIKPRPFISNLLESLQKVIPRGS